MCTSYTFQQGPPPCLPEQSVVKARWGMY